MNCVIDKMTSPRSLLMIQRAKELQKNDSSYISLAGGEPDFDTPAAVTEAAIASLRRGNTHYVVGPGIPELRQEIQQKLLRENGIQTEADRILVTPGGKMAIYLAVQAVLNHGDKVLLPEPAWVSYESIVISAGAEAVKVPLSPADHYRLTEALLEQHYTPEVRLIIINYPNNPTGRILHQDEAEALSAFMQRHPDVLLLSDEVYDAIVYDGVRSISMASCPEVADRVITINGFSKFAAMTGWRMGYLTARRDIYAAIYKLYQQSVSCTSGFLQEGAVQAFRIPDEVEAMRQSYQRRRDAFVGRLNAIPGDFVIRFMSSHPKDATEKLFRAMAECEKCAHQMHLPVQSGNDRVLHAMNRGYTREKYLAQVALARQYMPDLVLTTDIIVGFPGETDAEFDDTLSLIETVRYDAMFTFIYSPRVGTPAAKMPDPYTRAQKQVRFDALVAAANRISEEKHRAYEGSVQRVLVDGADGRGDHPLTARTKGGRLVHMRGDASLVGRFVDVKITGSNTWALYGEEV